MFDLNNELEIKVAKDILGRNVVVVDNFYKNPDEVRECALSNLDKKGQEISYGSFDRIVVDTDEVVDKLYPIYYSLCFDKELWMRDQIYDLQWFDEQWRKTKFICNITNDDTLLRNPLGIVPHQDYYPAGDDTFNGVIRSRFGSVIYLNTPEECSGGTNLYSYGGEISHFDRPESGIPVLEDPSQVELFDHIKSYIDNSIEHTFEMVYNRMVLYEADVLHGPSVELGKFKNFSRINQVLFM